MFNSGIVTADCSAVSCLKPVCEPGLISETPEGECCPKCVRGNVIQCCRSNKLQPIVKFSFNS